MKITIINGDNSVGIDGEFFFNLDFSEVPDEINAVHWKDGTGVIEYLNSTDKLDEPIIDLPAFYTGLKIQWDAAKVEKNKKEAEYLALVEQAKLVAAGVEATEKKLKEEEEALAKTQAESPTNPQTA